MDMIKLNNTPLVFEKSVKTTHKHLINANIISKSEILFPNNKSDLTKSDKKPTN